MASFSGYHNFLQKSTTATEATCYFFRKFAPQLRRPAMLQNRVVQNCNCYHVQSSSFFVGDKYEKLFQPKFRKIIVSYPINSSQPRVLKRVCKQNVHTPTSSPDGPIQAFSNRHQFSGVFANAVMPWNIFVRPGRPSYSGTCVKRLFSNIPNGTIGARDSGNGGKASLFNIFYGDKKHSKSLASHDKNMKGKFQVVAFDEALEASACRTANLALKHSDVVGSKEGNHIDDEIPTETVLGSLIGNGSKVNKPKGKRKQQSKSKKSKEQCLEDTAANDMIANPGVCETVDEVEKKSTKKGGKNVSATEDTSSSIKIQSEKGRVKSRKKPSKGEANALIEVSEIPKAKVSPGNVLGQKKKPNASGNINIPGKKVTKQLYPPSGKSVVVVESATKAKVIQEYLGDMFEVLPSYGHVRDLAARSGSVRPKEDFSMVWEVPSTAWTHLKSIKVALCGAENLILASDPDREGEAIAWHIFEMLQQQDALHEGITVARVVFNEITESSIKSALQSPRDIDANLVHAYLARRALDYLIGFNISPLLWRKLPGCQSAGRVQSAALSLLSDREIEIDEFKPQEYWSVDVNFKYMELDSSKNDISFSSHLTHLDAKKLDQLSVSSQTAAEEIERQIISSNFKVVGCKRNKQRRNPSPPFITSTLQQEAANKLHFSAAYTMKLAQKLYEGVQLSEGKAAGLITYTRTDGLHISDEAIKDIRAVIAERYGQQYASSSSRKFFKKVKNAQEAHEAIRPTGIWRLPSKLVGILDEDLLKLYSLIWARTVACQMEPAIIDQIQLDVGNDDHSVTLRTTCSKVGFLGYQVVYGDLETKTIKVAYENDENDRNEAFQVLSDLKTGDSLKLAEVELKQHHTQPPPRYSEASLVKKLEELGIGRPSTYATTIKVLQDRKYVTVKSRMLYPEFRGRMVSAFLSHHFSEVTDYSFTADMETELDNVSAGMTEWKGLLNDYWSRFSSYCDRAASIHIHQVEKMLEKTFGEVLFASLPNNSRTCPICSEGTLIFKVSRFGPGYFLGCDQHPKCKYIAKTLYGDEDDEDTPQKSNAVEEPKLLGVHPSSNEKILLKNGPYGRYLQLGEDRKGYVPKRASVTQIKDVSSITLEDAIAMLRYPVTLGKHPKDSEPVTLKITREGFAVRYRRSTAPVPKNMKPSEISLDQALELLSGPDARHCGRPKSKKKLEEAMGAI